uniref:Uncharacterized protein n=1 Tax=Timema tahoe TaxID=61484 RepID=A0A7R9ILI0_9NEOP|nr:unnamed protein product [Timema tahoe]
MCCEREENASMPGCVPISTVCYQSSEGSMQGKESVEKVSGDDYDDWPFSFGVEMQSQGNKRSLKPTMHTVTSQYSNAGRGKISKTAFLAAGRSSVIFKLCADSV